MHSQSKAIVSYQKARALTGAHFHRLKRGIEMPGKGGRLWVGYNGLVYYTRPIPPTIHIDRD